MVSACFLRFWFSEAMKIVAKVVTAADNKLYQRLPAVSPKKEAPPSDESSKPLGLVSVECVRAFFLYLRGGGEGEKESSQETG